MNEMNGDVIFLLQVLCQMFGAIDRTVLSARTTESDLQMREIAFYKSLHMMVNQLIYSIQEGQYFAVRFEEVDDGLVQAREGLVLLVLTRVMGAPAVKNIPAAVAGGIFRSSLSKGERVDRY